MNRLSKFVAVLALWGVVTAPTSMLWAHSACTPGPKDSGRGCQSVTVGQSSSICHMQAMDSSCCQIVHALPAESTGYPAAPTILLSTHNVDPPSFAPHN